MVALTFFGPERFDHHHVHPHESPSVMTVPLMVLAVLSVVGGVLGLPPVLHVPHALEHWLAPVIEPGVRILAAQHSAHELSHATEWLLLALGAAIALVFAHRGFHAFKSGPERDEQYAAVYPSRAEFLREAWRVDAGYASWIVLPLRLVAFVTAVVIDQFAIDGLVNGAGALARNVGERSRKIASGSVANYALWIGGGSVLVALLWVWS
jgi:NADH-quinone oxidoreductase subunit L